MEIKVLGLGCAKCEKTYAIIEKVIRDHNLKISLSKVEDIEEMSAFNCCITPAVVIDGTVVIKGRVPSEKDVLGAIEAVFKAKVL